MRVAVPTKDRPGNLSLALLSTAQWLTKDDELWLYDDGDRPATADYATRFALDLAVQRGAGVVIKRGKPLGIAAARAHILQDAIDAVLDDLLMVDDDVIVSKDCKKKLLLTLSEHEDAEYVVPVIALANNEAGVAGFANTGDNAPHPQYVLCAKGTKLIEGGAWTCAVLFDLYRFDAQEAVERLLNGPKVVEDYTLTAPMRGYVNREAVAWHCMTPEQGSRSWETLALEELRKQVGGQSLSGQS